MVYTQLLFNILTPTTMTLISDYNISIIQTRMPHSYNYNKKYKPITTGSGSIDNYNITSLCVVNTK